MNTRPTASGRSAIAPSLLSGEGGFPRTLDDLWQHADPAEVLRECRAQIERALAWGIDVTHLAPHLSAITLRPEFFDVYLELAASSYYPYDCQSTITAEQAGFPFRRLAAEEGVLFPDHFDHDWRAGSRERVYDAIRNLQPGVTEIHVQPVIDTPEVRAITDWRRCGSTTTNWSRPTTPCATLLAESRRSADRLPGRSGTRCESADSGRRRAIGKGGQ